MDSICTADSAGQSTDTQTLRHTDKQTDRQGECVHLQLQEAGKVQYSAAAVASQSSCSRGSPELHKNAPVGDWPRLAEERALNVADDISHYVRNVIYVTCEV